MAKFSYVAKTVQGQEVKGAIDAANEKEAREKLRFQKLIVLKLAQGNKAAGAKAPNNGMFGPRVSGKELQVFTRQFSVLISAGVPVVQSLEAMVGPGRSPAMTHALTKIVEDVGRGKRLGEALRVHPTIFDKMYINLVVAGEEGGVLDEVLKRLAEYIEKAGKIRRKVLGALTYPAVVMIVAMGVVAGILTFVIPKFMEMFKQGGQELPALTQFVVNLSNGFRDHWFIILLSVIAIPIGIVAFYRTPDGRKVFDKIFIDLPIFGNLIQKSAVARFSRTLSTLLGAGVRIMDALEISASTTGNWVVESALLKSKDAIARGKNLIEPLSKEKYIPTMVTQMIGVGEKTGNLDVMLGKIADFYEDEVENAAAAMMSLIEPLLMVFLGGIVAVLVIAMYLPIFNLAGALGK